MLVLSSLEHDCSPAAISAIVVAAAAKEGDVSELTQQLAQARAGDANAASMAFSLLYEDLKRIARAKLRQHQPMTLLAG